MGGGGGKDPKDKEYMYSVSMSTVRIFDKDLLNETLVTEAIRKPKLSKYTLQDTFYGHCKMGAYPLLNYHNFSKWYGPYSVPTCTLLDISIPNDQIKTLIAQKEQATVEDLKDYTSDWRVVTSVLWNEFRLQEVYNYYINSEYLYYLDKWYLLISAELANSIVTSTLNIVTTIRQEVKITTATVITPLDEQFDTKTVTVTTVTTLFDDVTNDAFNTTIDEPVIAISEVPRGTEQSSEDTVTEVSTILQEGETVTLTNPAAPLNFAYYVTYQLNGRDKVWIYYPLLGTSPEIGQVNIPTLDIPINDTGISIEMYPMTILRHNYYSIDEYDAPNYKDLPAGDESYTVYKPDTITEQTYEDTEWVVSSLNLTLDDLLEPIGENPDLNVIADVILCLAVEPADEHSIVSKTLFECFRLFNLNNTGTKAFSITRDPFNMGVSCESIVTTVETMNIGVKGTYTHTLDTIAFTIKKGTLYYNKETSSGTPYQEVYDVEFYVKETQVGWDTEEEVVWLKREYLYTIYNPADFSSESQVIRETIPEGQRLILRYQIEENVVEQTIVYGLKSATSIGRSMSATTGTDATSNTFVLPVPVDVVNSMSPLEKVQLMERGLRLIFYSAQLHVQHIQWYETGIFKVLLQVVAVIITFVVGYFTAGTGVAPLMAAFEAVLIGVGITLAINLLSQVIDVPYIKEILAIAAVVVGMATGYIDVSFMNVMTTAVDLVNLVTSITLGEIQQDTMDIHKQRMEAAEQYQATSEEYSDIFKGLNEGMTTESIVALGIEETIHLINPDSYYDMTLGTLYNYNLLFDSAYDTVHGFYDNKLKLD